MSSRINQNVEYSSDGDGIVYPKSLLTRLYESRAALEEHESSSSSESDYPRSTAGSGDEHSHPDIYKNSSAENRNGQPAGADKVAKDSSRAGVTNSTGDRDEPVASKEESASSKKTGQDLPLSTAAHERMFSHRSFAEALPSAHLQTSQSIRPAYHPNSIIAMEESAYRRSNASSNASSATLPSYEAAASAPESFEMRMERAKKLFRDAVEQAKIAYRQAEASAAYPEAPNSSGFHCKACSDIEARAGLSAAPNAQTQSNSRAAAKRRHDADKADGGEHCGSFLLFFLIVVLFVVAYYLTKDDKSAQIQEEVGGIVPVVLRRLL
jgi:hypothetical protein